MSRAIASERVLLGEIVAPATIIFSCESGKILHIEHRILDQDDDVLQIYNVPNSNYRNVTPLVVMPGLVDAHVHLNEPGRTEWEGFATGTQSAASGGVTTVIDMPLNAIPPTTTIENFLLKIDAAKGQTWVDVGFWGGMIPDNLSHLKPLISMGVRGFKGFLIESGVDEFPAISPSYIMKAMKEVENLPTLLMFHAEMQPNVTHGPVLLVEENHNKTPKLVPNENRAKFELLDEASNGNGHAKSNGHAKTENGHAKAENGLVSNGNTIQEIDEELENFELGMSASFINIAPEPVVNLLSKGYSTKDEREEFKNLHGEIDHSVLTDKQAKALAKSPFISGSEPKFGEFSRLANKRTIEEEAESPLLKAIDNDKVEKVLHDKDLISTPFLLAQNADPTLTDVDPTAYASFLASRPDNFETTAIAEIINCSTKIPTVPLHIVHLATHEAIPLLRAAKANNLPISAETCFHYLSLFAEKIPNCSTQYKCCPPIRSDQNRKLLWKALRDDLITTVVSDHSPCTPDLKGLEKGDFFSAWGGISSVGFGLPILYTEGLKLNPPISLQEITKWCSWNTAKQVGLSHTKGKLEVGYDADILLFDTEVKYTVQNHLTFFKNKLTAYHGMEFQGRVAETIVRGNSVFAFGKGHSKIPMGRLLLEPRVV